MVAGATKENIIPAVNDSSHGKWVDVFQFSGQYLDPRTLPRLEEWGVIAVFTHCFGV